MSMTSRIPCKFFQQGNCNRGANCSFAHIKENSNARWGGTSSFGANPSTEAPKYNETSFKNDLTAEKPIWDLSVYGPAKEEPNLIVGTDRSFEEDRLRYYLSRIQTGNETQFLQEREQVLQLMNQQVNAITSDPTGALRHFDTQKSKTGSAFGGSSAATQFEPFRGNSGFGSTGGFGNTGSAFGMGANTKASTSAFGGSAFGGSAFGSTNNSNTTPAFGSTGFQQPQTSAFGNTSQPASSAFGNAGSGFGAVTTQPAFGSTSSMGGFSTTPAFGAPSTFGAQAQPGLMNGVGSTPGFGANPPSTAQAPAFGMNPPAFGTSQPAPTFGLATMAAPSGFGSGFGAPAGQQPQPTSLTSGNAGSEQQAFLAPTFQYQMIPEQEPPLELR